MGKNFESIKIFICYDYIKNNSDIYQGDGSRIRIFWSCSNKVKTTSRIYHKILATGRPISKALIEYNSNSFEETMKKRRNQLILSLLIKNRSL